MGRFDVRELPIVAFKSVMGNVAPQGAASKGHFPNGDFLRSGNYEERFSRE